MTVPARRATVTRKTNETEVEVFVDIDGSGRVEISTGIGFFDHLLTSLGHHSLMDLRVTAKGDLEIDDHHTVEDTALVLGSALADALGDRVGIHRFADAVVPLDEALATAAIDLGGRPYAVIDLELTTPHIGTMTTQNITHALEALTRTLGASLHLTASGRNDHHVSEAAFKALARAIKSAMTIDPRRVGVPSTKGTL